LFHFAEAWTVPKLRAQKLVVLATLDVLSSICIFFLSGRSLAQGVVPIVYVQDSEIRTSWVALFCSALRI